MILTVSFNKKSFFFYCQKKIYLLEIGQEHATIGFDDDVKITPFNIDEELEEGHYDETGCFHWKKKDVCIDFKV
jgi:hypothetical protein